MDAIINKCTGGMHAANARPTHVPWAAPSCRDQHVRLIGIEQIVRRGHDVDGARINRRDVVGPPVAHEVVDLLEGFRDVLTLDPIDHVDLLAGAPGIHLEPPNIASAAQKSCGVRVCRSCGDECGAECAKKAAACEAACS